MWCFRIFRCEDIEIRPALKRKLAVRQWRQLTALSSKLLGPSRTSTLAHISSHSLRMRRGVRNCLLMALPRNRATCSWRHPVNRKMDEFISGQEAGIRRDEVIRHMANTPPQPKAKAPAHPKKKGSCR